MAPFQSVNSIAFHTACKTDQACSGSPLDGRVGGDNHSTLHYVLARPKGFEPLTYGLEGRCYYPAELRAHILKLVCQASCFMCILYDLYEEYTTIARKNSKKNIWCTKWDLNPHELSPTASSRQRVCLFHH